MPIRSRALPSGVLPLWRFTCLIQSCGTTRIIGVIELLCGFGMMAYYRDRGLEGIVGFLVSAALWLLVIIIFARLIYFGTLLNYD